MEPRPPTDVSLRGRWLPHWAPFEGLQHFFWEKRKGFSWLRKWRLVTASIVRFWPNEVFDPRRSPRHARRVQPRGEGEGETGATVAAAVLQFKEKSTGVREYRTLGETRSGFRRVTLEGRAQKTFETEVLWGAPVDIWERHTESWTILC